MLLVLFFNLSAFKKQKQGYWELHFFVALRLQCHTTAKQRSKPLLAPLWRSSPPEFSDVGKRGGGAHSSCSWSRSSQDPRPFLKG
jgi:hypothetical protein